MKETERGHQIGPLRSLNGYLPYSPINCSGNAETASQRQPASLTSLNAAGEDHHGPSPTPYANASRRSNARMSSVQSKNLGLTQL